MIHPRNLKNEHASFLLVESVESVERTCETCPHIDKGGGGNVWKVSTKSLMRSVEAVEKRRGYLLFPRFPRKLIDCLWKVL